MSEENKQLIKQETWLSITEQSWDSTHLLHNVRNQLLKLFPEKAVAILTSTEQTQEEEKKKSQLELEKDIAKSFKATCIKPVHYIKDVYHLSTPAGAYLVDKDKNILIWPAKIIGTGRKASGYFSHQFLGSSYVIHDDRAYVYCIDQDLNMVSLPKLEHMRYIKPVAHDKDVFIMAVKWETERKTESPGVTSSTTPYFEYLINRAGERLSAPYQHINENLIIEKGDHNNRLYSKLIKKEGKYEELWTWFHDVDRFTNGSHLLTEHNNDELSYYHLYDKDDTLLHTVEAVKILENLCSPYIGKKGNDYMVIYDGNVYELPACSWFYPVIDNEPDFLWWGTYRMPHSLFLRGPDNKLLLRKEGKIVDMKSEDNLFVDTVFYGQLKVYKVSNDVSLLVDKDGNIIDVGEYTIPYQRNEDKEFLMQNHYITKRKVGSDEYGREAQIISSSWAISKIFSHGVCYNDEGDRKIIREFWYIKAHHEEKYKLINITTCKECIDEADEIRYFGEWYIYVRRVTSPKPDYRQEVFLYDKNIQVVLGPVYDVRENDNMMRVTPLDEDGILSDYYLFPDFTRVGE